MTDYADLIRRLRGEYRVPIKDGLGPTGGGEEPDNPNEFVRKFLPPPIQKEAADAIENLVRASEAPTDKTWTVGAINPDFVPFDPNYIGPSDKINHCCWKTGSFDVLSEDFPDQNLIGSPGKMEFHGQTFDCAVVEMKANSEFFAAETFGSFGHEYVQGMRSLEITVLILEDRVPSFEPGTMMFTWEKPGE